MGTHVCLIARLVLRRTRHFCALRCSRACRYTARVFRRRRGGGRACIMMPGIRYVNISRWAAGMVLHICTDSISFQWLRRASVLGCGYLMQFFVRRYGAGHEFCAFQCMWLFWLLFFFTSATSQEAFNSRPLNSVAAGVTAVTRSTTPNRRETPGRYQGILSASGL